MEYFFVKLFLVLAIFATLLTFAFWANDKMQEYIEYFKDKKDKDK